MIIIDSIAKIYGDDGGRRFLDDVAGYISDSRRSGNLPTTAGFKACRRYTDQVLRALSELYPEAWDVARSMFIDAAVNCKAQNSESTFRYLISAADGFTDDTEYDVDFSDGE